MDSAVKSTVKAIVVLLAISAGVVIGYYAGTASWNAIVDYLNPNWEAFGDKIVMGLIAIGLILFFAAVTIVLAIVLGWFANALIS